MPGSPANRVRQSVVAQHDNGRLARCVVPSRIEAAARREPRLHHREVVGGDERPPVPLRIAGRADGCRQHRLGGREAFEGAGLPQVSNVRVRQRAAGLAGAPVTLRQAQQPSRIGDRKGPENREVDDGKNQRARTDADGRGTHRDRRESRGPAHRPQRVADVLQERVQRRRAPDGTDVLADERPVPERPPGGVPRGLLATSGVLRVFRLELQVGADLALDVLLALVPRQPPGPEPVPPAHVVSPV